MHRFFGGVVPESTWSDRHGMAAPPRPSYSGCFRWQSPVVAASSAVAPSLYWVQAHGTPVVQSADPAGGFFGRAGAPPICASSSFFVPASAGPWQNSISEIAPQYLSHTLRHLPPNFVLAHLVGFFCTFFQQLDFRLPATRQKSSVDGGIMNSFAGSARGRAAGQLGRGGVRQHDVSFFGLHGSDDFRSHRRLHLLLLGGARASGSSACGRRLLADRQGSAAHEEQQAEREHRHAPAPQNVGGRGGLCCWGLCRRARRTTV